MATYQKNKFYVTDYYWLLLVNKKVNSVVSSN